MKKRTSLILLFFPIIASAWSKQVDKDKMSDQKYVMLSQDSKEPAFSNKKASLTVQINCGEQKYMLLLSHPWVVGKGPVKIRLDKEKPFPLYARAASDKKIFILGDDSSPSPDRNPQGVIEKMKSFKNFLIQYEEAGGKTVEAEFNLTGLGELLKTPCK